ncbi:hypothetical protein ACFLUU_05860 [Chloroflexota bacterium]
MNGETTSEAVARGRSYGVVRCLNCFERISPPEGAKAYKCPHCSFEWRISWPLPDFPRIRGPVWDVNRRLAEEAVATKKGSKK